MTEVRFRGAAADSLDDYRLDQTRIGVIAERAEMGDHGPALLRALVEVEVGKRSGFLSDGRLRILFEAHRFDRYTSGKYRASHPNISSRSWNRSLYWGGAAEYRRLQTAMDLDRDAALMSASWGYPQMMGDEHWRCGYENAAEMINAFADSAHVQIHAMVDFLASKKALQSLIDCQFEDVSRKYNGRGFRANRHHIKLGSAAARFSGVGDNCRLGAAGEDVVVLQIALKDLGAELVIDGAFGPMTGQALVDAQRTHKTPNPIKAR
ncbi:MAG: N-acetylmuramidase domain-containing protein [Pseudomonadota bacterium]